MTVGQVGQDYTSTHPPDLNMIMSKSNKIKHGNRTSKENRVIMVVLRIEKFCEIKKL
jgi:hypothetical protein